MSFTLLAFLAAALYALNAPLSKLLLQDVSPAMMAAFLYLGAGIGMLAIGLIHSCVRRQPFRLHFTRKDAPYVAGHDGAGRCCAHSSDAWADDDLLRQRFPAEQF